jgi:hypothetical protein
VNNFWLGNLARDVPQVDRIELPFPFIKGIVGNSGSIPQLFERFEIEGCFCRSIPLGNNASAGFPDSGGGSSEVRTTSDSSRT